MSVESKPLMKIFPSSLAVSYTHLDVYKRQAIGAAMSCCFSYLPGLNQLSDGWVIIICGVVSSAIGAYFFPIQPKEEPEKEWKAQED